MLTTPARSDQRPPRPASMIGVVATRVAAMVPDDVRALAPVISSRMARNSSTPGRAAIMTQVGIRRVLGGGARAGAPVVVVGVLMRAPPRAHGAQGPRPSPPPVARAARRTGARSRRR